MRLLVTIVVSIAVVRLIISILTAASLALLQRPLHILASPNLTFAYITLFYVAETITVSFLKPDGLPLAAVLGYQQVCLLYSNFCSLSSLSDHPYFS